MCLPSIEGHIYVYTLYRRPNTLKYHRRISHKTGSSPSPAGKFGALCCQPKTMWALSLKTCLKGDSNQSPHLYRLARKLKIHL